MRRHARSLGREEMFPERFVERFVERAGSRARFAVVAGEVEL